METGKHSRIVLELQPAAGARRVFYRALFSDLSQSGGMQNAVRPCTVRRFHARVVGGQHR